MNNCEDRLQLVLGRAAGHGAPELLAARELAVPRRTVEFLLPAVAGMLAEQELPPAALTHLAVGRGPGSFTGVRLAIAAAEGLAAGAAERPLLAGLDHLALVAAGPLALGKGPVAVLTYARRGQVYLQRFGAPGPLCERLALPVAGAVALLEELPASNAHVLVGTGLHKDFDAFAPLARKGHLLLGPEWDHPSPGVLLAEAARAEYGPGPIEPDYGRAADAEDNLEAVARARGIAPAEARRMLEASRGRA
jgi:tRNA threonylcarbamoyl adenosine modification protein YeaZ